MEDEMNQQLFALGSIHPLGSPEGSSQVRAECLIRGADPWVEVDVRFVQTVERRVLDASNQPVEELEVTGRRYWADTETEERAVQLSSLPNRTAAIRTAGGERVELTEDGVLAGALVWRWEPLHGTVEAWTEEVHAGLSRVLVEVANRLEWGRATPEQNLLRTLHSTQVAIRSSDSALSSPGGLRPRPNRSSHPALR
jgi:hypothetical protein